MPKAYLGVLFFDERLNFIAESSSLIRVSQLGDGAAPLVLGNIRAPRNGYAYVYVSNESNEAVFFDDLKVQHRRSALLEETHYYPFGLAMAGISSKKLGSVQEGLLKNEYGYNEKELWDEADLNWYDYGFRNYDVQIGRFVQIDPLADISADNSGYHYALNDPIANIDYLGLNALDMVRCVGEMSSSLSNLISFSSVITSIATGAINVAGTIANQQTVIAQGQQGPGLPQAPVQKGLDGFRSAVKAPISLAAPKSAFNERTILDEFVVWVRQRVRTLEHNIYMEDVRTNTTLLERIVKDVIDPQNWETGGFGAGANLLGKVSKQELIQAARKAAKEELDEMAVKKEESLIKLAKKYGINANSTTSKELLENFDMKAADWISKYRKGSINRELGDISNKTIGEVFDAADSKMRKLILNGREKFKK